MTRNQEIVMWCGLIILLVYLFTDKNFKNTVFGKNASSGGATLDAFTTGDNPWAVPGVVPPGTASSFKAPAAKTVTL